MTTIIFLPENLTQKIETNDIYEYYHFCLETVNDDQNFGIWANGILSEATSKNNFMQKNYILL